MTAITVCQKKIPVVSFSGRILFLSENSVVVKRQLNGEDLTLQEALPLRSDVSTDEITPAYICYHYDEKLGEYPYIGVECTGEYPVKQGAIKSGVFAVTVAGRRYGKGSSREASPYAEWCAGIRLIIAESFERIYRQNCHNIGILTSTDFSLIDRIRRGEEIPLEEFTVGHDDLTAELIRRRGLFRLFEARRTGWELQNRAPAKRSMTYAEKVIARACNLEVVTPGQSVFVKSHWRYAHEYVSPMTISILRREFGESLKLHKPDSIICFTDHLTFIHKSMPPERRALGLLDLAQGLGDVQNDFCEQYGLRLHGLLKDREGSEGISHSIMSERYVLPGQIAVGTDSHTPHCGALGAVAFGIGATEMANAWVTGEVPLKIPQTCRVNLNGHLSEGVEAKDIVLHILRLPYVRNGDAIGKIFEYCGPVISNLPTDERCTLTNMVAEIGGFTGVVAPDAETQKFLLGRRGVKVCLEDWMISDAEAEYANIIDIDCSALEPMIATPGDPGNGKMISEVDKSIAVDIAYGGSCTGGKLEDIKRYFEVVNWAVKNGMQVSKSVRFILQFGSQDVREYCIREKMLDVFLAAGVELIEPGCGACVNAGPGVSIDSSQVTISSINRNFPGRSGPGKVWLASPSTVAASAIAGRITSFEQLKDNPIVLAGSRSG